MIDAGLVVDEGTITAVVGVVADKCVGAIREEEASCYGVLLSISLIPFHFICHPDLLSHNLHNRTESHQCRDTLRESADNKASSASFQSRCIHRIHLQPGSEYRDHAFGWERMLHPEWRTRIRSRRRRNYRRRRGRWEVVLRRHRTRGLGMERSLLLRI